MKQKSLILCLIFAVALVLFVPSSGDLTFEVHAQEAFYITNYEIDIVSNTDASYTFEERISVFFTSDRHGIIRSIPRSGTKVN